MHLVFLAGLAGCSDALVRCDNDAMRRRSATYGTPVPSPAGSRWSYIGIVVLVVIALAVVFLALRPRPVPSPTNDGVGTTPSSLALR